MGVGPGVPRAVWLCPELGALLRAACLGLPSVKQSGCPCQAWGDWSRRDAAAGSSLCCHQHPGARLAPRMGCSSRAAPAPATRPLSQLPDLLLSPGGSLSAGISGQAGFGVCFCVPFVPCAGHRGPVGLARGSPDLIWGLPCQVCTAPPVPVSLGKCVARRAQGLCSAV